MNTTVIHRLKSEMLRKQEKGAVMLMQVRIVGLVLTLGLLTLATPAGAVVVDYTGVNDFPLTTYDQDGFNLTQTNPGGSFGLGLPFGLFSNTPLGGVSDISFTKIGGGLFTLDSLRMGSVETAFSVSFVGYLGGILQATDIFQNTADNDWMVGETFLAVNLAGLAIDELRFSMDQGGANPVIHFFEVGDAAGAVAGPDHYLSHEVKEMKGTPKFEKRNVTLADQLEFGIFEVRKLKALYNPVDKNGEGIVDSETHLVGYEIKLDKDELKHIPQLDIQIDNQFGTLFVDTVKAERLLVPSAKSLTGPVDELADVRVDHFKCYKVEVTEGTPEFVPLLVTLEDQFIGPRVFEVEEPSRLCIPVDKNSEGILDFETHLMCYSVTRVDIANIRVNNQFGPLQVETKKQKRELCVPSMKTL